MLYLKKKLCFQIHPMTAGTLPKEVATEDSTKDEKVGGGGGGGGN